MINSTHGREGTQERESEKQGEGRGGNLGNLRLQKESGYTIKILVFKCSVFLGGHQVKAEPVSKKSILLTSKLGTKFNAVKHPPQVKGKS